MNEKNTYNQINNPTQINVGNQENSVQTIGRKVTETIDNPQPAVDTTTNFINTLVKEFFKSICTLIKCAIIPFFVCYYLAFLLIGIFNTIDKSIIEVLIIGTKILYEFPIFISQFLMPDIIISLFGPLLLLVIVGSIFLFMVISNYIKITYKLDKKRHNEITKAVSTVSILYFISKLFKNRH